MDLFSSSLLSCRVLFQKWPVLRPTTYRFPSEPKFDLNVLIKSNHFGFDGNWFSLGDHTSSSSLMTVFPLYHTMTLNYRLARLVLAIYRIANNAVYLRWVTLLLFQPTQPIRKAWWWGAALAFIRDSKPIYTYKYIPSISPHPLLSSFFYQPSGYLVTVLRPA